MSDEELTALTNRLGKAARILGIDELKIEHRAEKPGLRLSQLFALSTGESVMMVRIGDRKLTGAVPLELIEEARRGEFGGMGAFARWLVDMLRSGHVDKEDNKPTRFTAIALELDNEEEKK
jgi:hypothetical protein